MNKPLLNGLHDEQVLLRTSLCSLQDNETSLPGREFETFLAFRPPFTFGTPGCAGRDWGQEEKGTTEGEMAGWHH